MKPQTQGLLLHPPPTPRKGDEEIFFNVPIALKCWSIYTFLSWNFINGLKQCKSEWLLHAVTV